MNRWMKGFVVFLVLYTAGISLYLFQAEPSLSPKMEQTAADPSTFMDEERLQKTKEYTQIRNWLFFLGFPYEWAVYVLIAGWGWSRRFRDWSERWSGRNFVRTTVYTILLFVCIEILLFPLHYYGYQVRLAYGLSNQVFSAWFIEMLKGLLVELLIAVPLVWLFFQVVRKSPKRWWLWFGFAAVPVLLFLMFLQPLVIDPFFHPVQPLRDSALKQEILQMAETAGVPADQVFEVKMSEKTNALNAYVNGIGGSTRIVLWDTTLEKLEDDEIRFIMAHEIGHYVMNHMLWMFLGSVGGIFVLLYLLHRFTKRLVGSAAARDMGIRSANDVSILPVLLLMVSLFSFAVSPVSNTVSRMAEKAADQYAIELTGDKEAAVRSFQSLAKESLAYPNPPMLVKIFRYTHPSLAERILRVTESSKKSP